MKAGIDMDGSLYTLTGPEMSKPFLFIESEEYYNVKKQNTDPDIDAEEKIMNNASLNGGGRLYIKGTAHYNFTDLQLYSSLLKFTGMTGSIDSARSNEIVNRLVLDFFNEHLKGIPQNAGEPGTAGYDEVVRP